jgi:hypothetical protein
MTLLALEVGGTRLNSSPVLFSLMRVRPAGRQSTELGYVYHRKRPAMRRLVVCCRPCESQPASQILCCCCLLSRMEHQSPAFCCLAVTAPTNGIHLHRVAQELGFGCRDEVVAPQLGLTVAGTHGGVVAHLRHSSSSSRGGKGGLRAQRQVVGPGGRW